MIRGFGLIRY